MLSNGRVNKTCGLHDSKWVPLGWSDHSVKTIKINMKIYGTLQQQKHAINNPYINNHILHSINGVQWCLLTASINKSVLIRTTLNLTTIWCYMSCIIHYVNIKAWKGIIYYYSYFIIPLHRRCAIAWTRPVNEDVIIWFAGPWSQHLAMSPTENRRQSAIQELIDTEESYVKDMKIVNEVCAVTWCSWRYSFRSKLHGPMILKYSITKAIP